MTGSATTNFAANTAVDMIVVPLGYDNSNTPSSVSDPIYMAIELYDSSSTLFSSYQIQLTNNGDGTFSKTFTIASA